MLCCRWMSYLVVSTIVVATSSSLFPTNPLVLVSTAVSSLPSFSLVVLHSLGISIRSPAPYSLVLVYLVSHANLLSCSFLPPKLDAIPPTLLSMFVSHPTIEFLYPTRFRCTVSAVSPTVCTIVVGSLVVVAMFGSHLSSVARCFLSSHTAPLFYLSPSSSHPSLLSTSARVYFYSPTHYFVSPTTLPRSSTLSPTPLYASRTHCVVVLCSSHCSHLYGSLSPAPVYVISTCLSTPRAAAMWQYTYPLTFPAPGVYFDSVSPTHHESVGVPHSLVSTHVFLRSRSTTARSTVVLRGPFPATLPPVVLLSPHTWFLDPCQHLPPHRYHLCCVSAMVL
uniref:Uncharacterized protein n=2 Tax=Lygus hesperus TaxID=30085 RepID=A0A146LN55_LYGHE